MARTSELATGRNGCNQFWLYDINLKGFIADTALDNIFRDEEIYIDGDTKIISTGGRSGVNGYGGNECRWNGRVYELFAEVSNGENDDGTASIDTRKESINGEWKVVKSDTTYYNR